MYHSHNTNRHYNGQLQSQFIQPGNSIGIRDTNFIWDKKKNRLILIIETNQMVGTDVNAHLKGNRLLLEASLISFFDKPVRTHLIERDLKDAFEEGLAAIGFSEIKLKSRYHYQLIACQVIDSKLIKVILGYSLLGKN